MNQTPGCWQEQDMLPKAFTTLLKKLLVSPQSDLPAIKEKFQQMYQKPLAEAVRSDTSGDFRKLLLAILH